MFKITNDEMVLVNILEQETGARATDVLVTENTVWFLVQKGDLGRAIGRGGNNLRKLRDGFGKNVELVEASEELKKFLANFFHGVVFERYEEKEEDGKKSVFLRVNASEKGKAIGKGGEKINVCRELIKRHFGVDELRIF